MALVIVVPSDKDWWVAPQPYPDFTMAAPIPRDDRRAVSCSGLRRSQLTAPKTYTTRRDITEETDEEVEVHGGPDGESEPPLQRAHLTLCCSCLAPQA